MAKSNSWDKDKWISFQTNYIETLGLGKYIKLDCEHYVHDIEYKRIAEESKQFIKSNINRNKHNSD